MRMKTPTHPRYFEDEQGQWWCHLGPASAYRGRARCKIKTCTHCREEYVVSPHSAERSKFCSRECFGLDRRGTDKFRRENSSRWTGGRIKRRGYVLLYMPDHHSIPAGTQRKYVLEHRVVMEQHLGRPLESFEQVHHLNGQRDDNRIENLELWTTGHSTPGIRASDAKHCPTCTCADHAG